MSKSTITIDVILDENRVPAELVWQATESTADSEKKAKAMMLSLWDGAEKAALRIDLWTKEMMVDEMGDFFYQTLITMADTLDRATHQHELVEEMKTFAADFYTKFRKAEQHKHQH